MKRTLVWSLGVGLIILGLWILPAPVRWAIIGIASIVIGVAVIGSSRN